MTSSRLFLAVAAAAVLILGIASCGGDDGGGSEDPQQVLDATFSGEKDYSSGVVDADLEVSGEGEQGGTFEASVQGPFQSGGGGFPLFDLALDVSGEGGDDFDFSGEVTSTGDRGFVNFQGTDYQIDPPLFNTLKSTFSVSGAGDGQEQGNQLEALGIDPSNWLTDLSNEGEEDVEGTEAIHISGSADIDRFVDDVVRTAERRGIEQLPSGDILTELKDSVKKADFEVFSGKEDETLRRLDAEIEFEPPEGTLAGLESFGVAFSLTFSELGEEQTIEGPTQSQPLSGLLGQLGIDLGDIQGAIEGGIESGGAALGGSGGTPSPPSEAQSSAYLECLQSAQGADEIQACAGLLP